MPRSGVDYETKYRVLQDIEKGIKYSVIAKKYGLKCAANVSRIKQNKDKIETELKTRKSGSHRKTIRRSKYEDVNQAVLKIVTDARKNGLPVSDAMVREIASQSANELGHKSFGASVGWLHKFKKRHDIVYGTADNVEDTIAEDTFAQDTIAEVTVAEEADTDDKEVINDWMSRKLPEIIAGYDLRDIYNADETGLLWRALPDEALKLRDQSCETEQYSEERVTILLVTNADGSDRKVLDVIGNSRKPQCFAVKKTCSLPVVYHSSPKAWMTSDIWTEIWMKFNRRMMKEDRKVLMFVDDCPAHPKDIPFSNIKFVFLPERPVSCLQPLEAGIIWSFKASYRQELVKLLVSRLESDSKEMSIDLFDAINLMRKSWNNLNPNCIINCFRRCGFFGTLSDFYNLTVESNFDLWPTAQSIWKTDIAFECYVDCDDHLITCSPEDIPIKEERVSVTEINPMTAVTQLTNGTAIDCIANLRRFFMDSNCDEKFFDYFDQMQSFVVENSLKSVIQSRIADHFK